jgi:hypothetical protein
MGDRQNNRRGSADCCYKAKDHEREKRRKRKEKKKKGRKAGDSAGGRMMEKKRSGQGRNEDVQGGKKWGKVPNGNCR